MHLERISIYSVVQSNLMTWLRLGRLTRFLPRFPVNFAHTIYRHILKADNPYRISNFDGDLKLDLNLKDSMGCTLWHIPGRWEKTERKLFCLAITSGCTVLDVGANIGAYTLLAAKRGARVFAVEADPTNTVMLRHHLSLNRLAANVTVFELAASDHNHRVGLLRNPANCGGSTVTTGSEVEATTIDSLGLPPIDVCKMDIEGSELKALMGMTETLKRSPGMKLLIECNEKSDHEPLLGFLQQHFRLIKPLGVNLWCSN